MDLAAGSPAAPAALGGLFARGWSLARGRGPFTRWPGVALTCLFRHAGSLGAVARVAAIARPITVRSARLRGRARGLLAERLLAAAGDPTPVITSPPAAAERPALPSAVPAAGEIVRCR
ncbi:MAG: hypothetical protein KC420_20445, partial [Myxococcales bacterium]|nr:hypothetical protein [Myxococcales bacterium]